jgi:hypothetical protein
MSDHLSSSQLRKWTIRIYLAGDNNLESYGLKDLSEMRKVGSSTDVAIVAQLAGMADQVAWTDRYRCGYFAGSTLLV